MAAAVLKHHLIIGIVMILEYLPQILAETCGGPHGVRCKAPYRCCHDNRACCYDHTNRYTRSFRIHVWNMWYFWLVIIFLAMTCFGGCGYYRRRRLAMLQQQSGGLSQTRAGVTLSTPSSRSRRTTGPQPGYILAGPTMHTSPEMQLPPPYAEVMQQPAVYPGKGELPPYPGPPGSKDIPGEEVEEVSPPPYLEIAPLTVPNTNETTNPAATASHVAVTMEPNEPTPSRSGQAIHSSDS